jgi:polyhydroxyalkanoate synthesis repressor PhaR
MPEHARTSRKTGPVTIKKYANRRLYNTATSTYVTLDDLAVMVKEGTEFNVYDAKSGEEITRSVLTQIIMEAENKGQSLLPTSFLRKLIGFYGGNMDWVLGKYLDQSMQTFSQNQDKMRETLKTVTGGMFPVTALEEMGKNNLAMFERTMKMFSPFGEGDGTGAEAAKKIRAESERSLDELQGQLDKLQQQISDIMKGRK